MESITTENFTKISVAKNAARNYRSARFSLMLEILRNQANITSVLKSARKRIFQDQENE
jgi:hypothetical protein